MSKVVCREQPIEYEVETVTLYRPLPIVSRMYPWRYECPVCRTYDGIIEGRSECPTCKLKLIWLDQEESLHGDSWKRNVKALWELGRKVNPVSTHRRIVL